MNNFCSKCGRRLDRKTGRCLSCDRDFLIKKKRQRKNFIGTLILIIMFIVCCGAGIMYLCLHHTLEGTASTRNSSNEDQDVLVTATHNDTEYEDENDSDIDDSKENCDATSDNQFHQLEEKFTDIKICDDLSAIAAAIAAAAKMELGNAADDLSVMYKTTAGGLSYYRLQQNYQGQPVFGRTMVVIADASGNAQAVSSNALNIESVNQNRK